MFSRIARRAGLAVFTFAAALSYAQQQPVALPNTFSTVAGGGAAYGAGAVCSAGATTTAADTLGDGCAATLATLSSDIRGGVATDPAGNVFVADTSNAAIRMIDARSGTIQLVAGKGAACSSKTDSNGDGCPLANTAFSSTPRGIAADPYGNVLIAGYGSGMVQVACLAASPLCPNTAGTHQVGSMYLVAGCVTTTGSAGTNGAGADGGTATPTGTCNSTVAQLNQPRGVAADRYGNVLIADTGNSRYRVVLGPASYNGVANPMFALVQANPAYASATIVAGNIYPILGGFTAPASGAACTSGSSATSLNAFGDGCPYYVAGFTTSSTSAVQGVAADLNGNILFTDLASQRLRVIYLGGAAMANAIRVNNPTVSTPTVGSIYTLAGGGTTSTTTAPLLGSSANIDTNAFKVTTDNAGNIYIGDSTFVLFYDLSTGYLRRLVTTGSVCSSGTSLGDGCSATQASFGGSNGLGVAVNAQGDLFLADSNNARVRRVAATALLNTAVNSTSTQSLLLHAPAGATGVSAASLSNNSGNPVTLGTPACGTARADNTLDCTVPVTYAPKQPGQHANAVAVGQAGTSGGAAITLQGGSTGPALTFDSSAGNATAATIGTGLRPSSLAVDTLGNLYTYDLGQSAVLKVSPAGAMTTLPGALQGTPTQITVDASGDVYVVGDGSANIVKITLGASGSYTASTVPFLPNGAAGLPKAIAADSAGNLFIYDSTSNAVYHVAQSPLGVVTTKVLASSVSFTPVSINALAVDGTGSLYLSDFGAQKIYYLPGNKPFPWTTAPTALAGGNAASAGIAGDVGGSVYTLNASTKIAQMLPLSGPAAVPVYANLTTPSGIAVDGAGNVYLADSAQTSLLKIARSAATFSFGTSTSATAAGFLSNTGNAVATGLTQTDTTDFQVIAGSTNGCAIAGTSFAAGSACSISATFTPQAGTGNVADVLTWSPAATASGSFSLTGTKSGSAVTTTTSISGQTPASPVYSASGTEVTFTVTVAASTGTASGSVNVTVDTAAPVAYTLGGNGTATVALSGLTAGTHTISASYPSQNGLTGSTTTSSTSFSIAQASVSVAWTPGSTTQPFSRAIGTAVLNATAVIGGTSTPAPGSFVYTATPSGGGATGIDASSYLPIGSYALGVTFVPTDSTDYTGGTASIASYSVSKASTTAALGGTQTLVASDGTGNFSTVQAALNSLPVSGGSVFVKPGTYTGFITVNLPNVSIRGLGGDPTKVVLTNEWGAFSPPYQQGQGAGNNGSTGDQGSATLVVAKGTVNGMTTTPNNFYMEGVTVANTYDTNTTNQNPVGTIGGVCQAIANPTNNFALYNGANTASSPGLCNSQALATWITSDGAVLNNVRMNSLQDTLYAGSQGCGATCTVARQYYWHGKITGDVDYIFGDAAAVFDQANIYTVYHGTSATGTTTIEAQNKHFAAGSAGDYLSGYVFNRATFTSQSTGMTNLYLGRPYGQYSTNILLNSYIDQVNPLGYLEFSGQTNLPTSLYQEFNSTPYTDPASGQPDANGVVYTGQGGNTGSGVAGPRETVSVQPIVLNAAQAAPWLPVNFLGSTVGSASLSAGQPANWDPTVALASGANAFAAGTSPSSVNSGSAFTVLMRPQTPGAGVVPTGTWTLYDNNTQVATGTLDAAGQAYYSTTGLSTGQHSFTWSYGGDSNFSSSITGTPYVVTVAAVRSTPSVSLQSSGAVYGSAATVTVSVSGTGSNSVAATGTVSLSVDGGAAINGTLNAGSYTFSLNGLAAGSHALSANYGGDSNYNSASTNGSVSVSKAVLQVTANSFTVPAGSAVPAYTASYSGFVNGDTQSSAVTGAPSLSTNPATPSAPGTYTIYAAAGSLAAANYSFSFINGTLTIQPAVGIASVATGDTRNVTEPVFPSACTTLQAALTSVNDDIPASVDATNSNPDGARIQAALNSCAGTNQAVRLSADSQGHNAFLTGPLTMPSGVTLLVEPAITVYFSRNVQDYDAVAGTHTCGTINSSSQTSTCLPLINVLNVSNVAIMGYGKLDGRGGDTLLNTFPAASYGGQSWWGLSALANGVGNQQNPRFIQINRGSNVTLYKITIRNSPLFHVSTTGGGVTGLTAWDVKIVTPTSSRNTDGIDPGNATNVTVTKSWVSDGDDNIAVGASGTGSANISITGNHFFAGHGESIGSYTGGGVNNVLFDGNMLAGNSSVDSNSTGIRIKSANDRGGLVQNIQYSNSCFQNHKTEVQFTPLYNTNSGTSTPNFRNILLQNLAFLTEGTVQFTGASNNGTVNPLTVTLDNVSFKTLLTSDFNAAPSNAQLTYGPGQVSSNFVAGFATFVGSNGNTVNDQRTASALVPPNCSFTAIAPELTGPDGAPQQAITAGQAATLVVILTPAVGGSAYPTGAVTLTDQATGQTYTATLPGNADTIFVPVTGLSAGSHTFVATYAGDSNYVPSATGIPYATTNTYAVQVNAGSLANTTTTVTGVANSSYGSAVTVTATVTGSNPTGAVQFVVNGATTASSTVSNGTASATLNLPVGSYSLRAVYSGDNVNAGSASSSSSFTVAAAGTVTTLAANNTTTTLGVPVRLTATVTSSVGTPTGSVTFTYTTASNATPVTLLTSALTNGAATASANLPVGTDSVTATYTANGNYGTSASSPITITVNLPTAVPLPTDPEALAYTIGTLVGGSTGSNTACSGSTDAYGNGCQGTAINLSGSSLDLRSVVADPFGNVYFTDANASQIRRLAPNGVVTLFAGYVSGTACVPTATTSCTPTQVKLNKPRGIGTDAAGNLYIAGYSDNKVYKVSVTTGLMSLIAGTGTKPSDPTQSNGDGAAATSALLNGPRGVWADNVGNIYIADTTSNKVRVVDSTGNIQTLAGIGTAASTGDGGAANVAAVNNPQAVLTDPSGNVYIAEASRIRVVCVTCSSGSGLYQLLNKLGVASPQNGSIYTLAGGGTSAYSAPALANTVTISPQKLAMDLDGNLYVSDSGGSIWFIDSRTAYLRRIAGGATSSTVCNPGASAIGDGCPATQAVIGNAGNGIGVGIDVQGNVYVSDTLNARIRKVSTNTAFGSLAVNASQTATVLVHLIAGDTPQSAMASGKEFVAGSPTCSTNTDSTVDCLLPVTFTPAIPGLRRSTLTVSASNGHTATVALSGTGLGSGVLLDPATQVPFGSNLQIKGVAVDGVGNVYVSDATSHSVLKYTPDAVASGTGANASTLATLTSPGPLAVDGRGYVYVADTSTGRITQIAASGATSTLGFQFTSPAGMALDALNNLYISDGATVYQFSPVTGAQKPLVVTGAVAPAGLTVDNNGNLIVTDPGSPAVYSYSIARGTTTPLTTIAARPSGVAVDPAGNLVLADAASIVVQPASANNPGYSIASVGGQPLALDGAGNVYTAGTNGSVLLLQRTSIALNFTAASSGPQQFTVLSSGNQPLNITGVAQTDATNYQLVVASGADCVQGSNPLYALPVGGVCAATASFQQSGSGSLQDLVTLSGPANAALSASGLSQILLTSTPTAVKAALTSPTPGSVLPDTTVTFNWTPGTNVANYVVYVGKTPGGIDYYGGTPIYGSTSLTVSGLPNDGSTVYVRLFSQINGAYQYNDYTYTAATAVPAKAEITSPAPGSVLPGSTATFNWTPGTGVANYVVYVGKTPGGIDYYAGTPIYGSTSLTVSGLPVDGSTVYVRLFSQINGAYQYNDYTYTAATAAPVKAEITSPTPGSVLSGSTAAFNWTPGTNVANYVVYVGKTPGGIDYYGGTPIYGSTSLIVSGLPVDGSTVYVRLFSQINGAYQYNDYTYTAATQP